MAKDIVQNIQTSEYKPLHQRDEYITKMRGALKITKHHPLVFRF